MRIYNTRSTGSFHSTDCPPECPAEEHDADSGFLSPTRDVTGRRRRQCTTRFTTIAASVFVATVAAGCVAAIIVAAVFGAQSAVRRVLPFSSTPATEAEHYFTLPVPTCSHANFTRGNKKSEVVDITAWSNANCGENGRLVLHCMRDENADTKKTASSTCLPCTPCSEVTRLLHTMKQKFFGADGTPTDNPANATEYYEYGDQ